MCAECERRGYVRAGDDVDHMVPVRAAPERRLDPTNLQTLCAQHHNVWKRRLEQFAAQTDQMEMLDEWCRRPDMRPVGHRIVAGGPLGRIHAAAASPQD